MDMTRADGARAFGWAHLEACTLPTARRPLRLAEFDELFTTTLRSVERDGEAHARLSLAGDIGLAERAQRLADAETECCAFFTFDVCEPEPGRAILDIAVPPAYVDVLAGLVSRAETAIGADT